ncbi:MAG: aminoacyl-tRNA hydrolase [Bacteroidales bacterium]|nr:aminoacyl-tRNA hydrolase [Candidatus Cryptobacteroides fimicaballi]
MPGSYLIAGLGNIGPEYASTRHNLGFMVLDAWAKASDTVFESRRYGDLAVLRIKGREFYLLKPSTYMNLSGNAIRYWLGKLPITEQNLLVICDDLNLGFGTVRLRKKGSDGGHNGLKNIIETIGTQDFARIRIGIGNDFEKGNQIDFVVGELTPQEKEQIDPIALRVIKGIQTWAFEGADRAMNELNVRQKAE